MNSYNREILRLALPSIATNVTVPLLGLVDLAIVGHIGNETMIGAIAVGSMIFNVMYWLMGFLRMGTTGMTANTTLVGEVLSRFLRLAFLIALCFLVLQVPLRWLSLWLMGPSEGVAAYVRVYFNICIWGAPAVLGLYVMSGWFIGMKDTRTPMIVSISQNLINILLSLLFVFVFGMKIEGVALGTLIAQWSGALMAWGKANPGRPTPQPLPVREGSEMPNQVANQEESQAERVSTPLPSREGQGVGLQEGGSPSSFGGVGGGRGVGGSFSFFQVNRDIFLRTVCLVAVNLFFTSAGARQGDLLLSVNTLLLTFFTLFSYVMDGFANAGEALCGKTASQEMDKGMVIRHLFRWGWLMVVLFTAVYALGGRAFLSLLSDEGHVVDAAMAYLPWALLIPISGMAAFVYDGVFIGMLLTRGMLVSCAVATAAFFGLFFMLFPQWHNHSLWLALIVYLALRGLMQWIILKKQTI